MNERIAKINGQIDAFAARAQAKPTPANAGRWVVAEAVGTMVNKFPHSRADPSLLDDALALFESVMETLENDALSVFNEAMP